MLCRTLRTTTPLLVGLVWFFCAVWSSSLHADELTDAIDLAWSGRYSDARIALLKLPASVERDDTLARMTRWTGTRQRGIEALRTALQREPKSTQLHARLGQLLFEIGDYQAAAEPTATALKLDSNHLLARWIDAELKAETGRLKEALDGYVWFVRYYNRAQPTDADDLHLVALGSLQYARWRSSSQIFGFIINTLCADALKDRKEHWEVWKLSGDVLLEKYNKGQAKTEFAEALDINPDAAPVHASLANLAFEEGEYAEAEKHANKALALNPKLISALWMLADLKLNSGDVSAALEVLETARKANPSEQRTLGRIAGCYLLADGPPEAETLDELLGSLDRIDAGQFDDPSRFVALAIEVAERNPHPGPFLYELGLVVERRRRYPLAQKFYETAMRLMPQLSGPKTALGMLYLRTGQHDEAKSTLDAAFKLDPYHVRVNNMRKVLRVLEGYEEISTDHFVIHVDSTLDRVLGEYMADFLEETHAELSEVFDFEPPARTHFEIYNRSKGRSGHEWFSTRMIGLPWIQTIGASTGVIVALTSPTANSQPFNWARVLRHEYVHVLTLQQTKFNIPHWFTEALAVSYEGGVEPDEWAKLLLERVPRGQLKSLDELNAGFTRPETPDDWQFAYCQSRHYAKYMVERFGDGVLPKMLDAYRRNLSTEEAIRESTGVTVADFEAGYRKSLRDLVTELNGGTFPTPMTLEELRDKHNADPNDATIAGRYALALLADDKPLHAVRLANEVREREAGQPHATLVIARQKAMETGDAAALEFLLDELILVEKPERTLLETAFRLAKQQDDLESLELLAHLGEQHYAWNPQWTEGLVVVYLHNDDREQLTPALERLAALKSDSAAVRKLRAEIAHDQQDWEGVIEWCTQTVHIDVTDAEVHEMFGEAASRLGQDNVAEREWAVALELQPDRIDSRVGLVKLFRKLNRTADADAQYAKLKELHPSAPEVKELAP